MGWAVLGAAALSAANAWQRGKERKKERAEQARKESQETLEAVRKVANRPVPKAPERSEEGSRETPGIYGRRGAYARAANVRKGGRIQKTGTYNLHKGEIVVPPKLSRKITRKVSRRVSGGRR